MSTKITQNLTKGDTETQRLEYRRRSDFVRGIVVAGIFGFLINVFASIYYNAFLTDTIQLSSYKVPYMVGLVIAFFAVIAFLQFIVIDYKNDLHLEKGFWRRYFLFVTEDFAPLRYARYVQRFLISVLLLIFSSVIIFALVFTFGVWSVVVTMVIGITAGLIGLISKDRYKRRNG
jgi:hypothetical protein